MTKRYTPQNHAPPDFSERIKDLRVTYALTQTQLADLLGVSYAAVSRWEHGVSQPSAQLWQAIAYIEQSGPSALGGGHTGLSASPGHHVHLVHESGVTYAPPIAPFTAAPEDVRLAVAAHRLEYGYLVNPALATEVSPIEPLPHQRIAVYERMLPESRLHFLLADDAGAGKTIMTGLYVREMLARRLLRRVLIVPLAGLVGNWRREMETLFSLPFRIVGGADARNGANPFVGPESDLVIVSVDTLAGDRMFACLQDPNVAPYDLVVFDEAHKLSADRDPDLSLRKTDRYRLAEALAGVPIEQARWRLDWSARHLLLLTATPHMGKDFPYYALWRLLEPEALSTVDAFNAYPAAARRERFIRRTKEEMVYFDGRAIYPQRQCDTLSYDLTPAEQQLYVAMTTYIERYYNQAGVLNRSAARLAMSVFQRRLASSTWAVLRSLERRAGRLTRLIDDIQAGRLSEEQLRRNQREAPQLVDVYDEKTADEEQPVDGLEESEVAEEEALGAVTARNLADLLIESDQVRQLVGLAREAYNAGDEAKFVKLREVLGAPEYAQEKFIIFTEHRDTLDFLTRRLEGLGFAEAIARIHGGMDFEERERQVARFRKPLAESGARYLLATDAAGEGINLQFCWLMVNYDIPWNPARQEQGGTLSVSPVEQLLLLRDGQGVTPEAIPLIAIAEAAQAQARVYLQETVAQRHAEAQRARLRATLPERERLLRQGYSFQEAELAEARNRVRKAAQDGDPHAKAELTRIRERQVGLEAQREEALATMRREIELIAPDEVVFLAHALVLPSREPADQLRQDAEIEAIAVQVARAYEEALGAEARDVSTAALALAAGLAAHPGFDLRSRRLDGIELAIEVKGRAGIGQVEMTENEYIQACNLGDRYWLYTVFDCASAHPPPRARAEPLPQADRAGQGRRGDQRGEHLRECGAGVGIRTGYANTHHSRARFHVTSAIRDEGD